MSYEQKSLSGFSAVLSYAGDLPTLPVSGLVFSPFSDTEVNTTIKQYIRTNTVQTSAPSAASGYNTRTGEWSSSVGWQKTIPQADNVPTWVSHAVISGSGTNVTISWTNPTLFYSNNRATGVVYYTEPQADDPSKPTATDFSFTTFVMTFGAMESGAANKWQQQPFSYDVTDTLKKQYTCEYIAEKHPGSNTATVTFSSPRGYVGIADDLESNNYQAGSAGWKIKRDNGFAEFGSAAIRGTLTVGQLPSGTLNANDVGALGSTVISGDRITTGTLSVDRIAPNAIGMTKLTGDIQSTNYSSGSAGWRIQQSGSSEFNGPVISRNIVADSFTFNATGFNSSSYSLPYIANIVNYIADSSINTGAWGGNNESYIAAATIDGNTAVHYQTGQANNTRYGFNCTILPLTRQAGGTSFISVRISIWARYLFGFTHVSGGSTYPISVKIYKVT